MKMTMEELDGQTIECLPAREVMSTMGRGGSRNQWGGHTTNNYDYHYTDNSVNILNGAKILSGNNVLNGNTVIVKL